MHVFFGNTIKYKKKTSFWDSLDVAGLCENSSSLVQVGNRYRKKGTKNSIFIKWLGIETDFLVIRNDLNFTLIPEISVQSTQFCMFKKE